MMVLARAFRAKKLLDDPPERKPRKQKVGHISKRRFLRALDGTGGLTSLIAARLDCVPRTVQKILERSGWEDVAEAYQEECDRVTDLAETVVIKAMQQETDPLLAVTTAKWFLQRRGKDRGFGEETKVKHEGHIDHAHLVAVSTLGLPLDVMRKVLEAVERRELTEGNSGAIDADYSSQG